MSSMGLNIRIPKESLIKLKDLVGKEIVVKFAGGREVFGQLKSWDKSMNLVLAEAVEVTGINGKEEETLALGLIIVKGSQIQCISLRNGYTIIDNPFIGEDNESENEEEKSNNENNEDEDEDGDKDEREENEK